MLRPIFFFISALILCSSVSYAQPEGSKVAQFGIFVHGGLNLHSANFQTLPGVPSCCPRYENGSGLGGDIGMYGDMFVNSLFSIEMRLAYSTLNATLRTDEFTTVEVNNIAAPGEFEHSVKAS